MWDIYFYFIYFDAVQGAGHCGLSSSRNCYGLEMELEMKLINVSVVWFICVNLWPVGVMLWHVLVDEKKIINCELIFVQEKICVD